MRRPFDKLRVRGPSARRYLAPVGALLEHFGHVAVFLLLVGGGVGLLLPEEVVILTVVVLAAAALLLRARRRPAHVR